jgi:trans-aconitate 2-methyltransferase
MAEEALGLLTLEGTASILDVGCSDGKITAEIAARLARGMVLGVDPSHEMIAFAASHCGSLGHANLRFEVADVRYLPYRHAFDLVVSFNVLYWVPAQNAALRSIAATMNATSKAILRFVPA